MTDQSQPELGETIDVTELTIDLDEITLGEMSALELASGTNFVSLFGAGQATRRLIALFLREYRSSGRAPSWLELGSLRPRGRSSSTSPSASAGRPPKSSA